MSVYDGLADEYDTLIARMRDDHTNEVVAMLLALAGSGPGIAVDVGCGTGLVSGALVDESWTVIGVDISREEIGIVATEKRLFAGVVGDVERLPIALGRADLVVSTYTHTDVPSWPRMVQQIAYALRSGGRCVYVGMHPAFVGAHAQRIGGKTVLHTGYYRDDRLRFDGPGLTPGGWRRRVGVRHWTLGAFLTAFPAAGLTIERVVEGGDGGPRPGGGDMPWLISVQAIRF